MGVLLLALIAQVALGATAQSWSWPDGNKGGSSGSGEGSTRRGSGGRQRYDVFESNSDDFTLPHPEDLGAVNRPLARPPPPPPPPRPPRPYPQEPNFPLLNPNPAYRPRPPVSDLHGPSKCKCALPFNCEANSLQFGSCDAGKQYCCTKEARGPRDHPGGQGGSRPAVLVGPGGPLGVSGTKESYGGGYSGAPAQDVLTGPRPAHYRPDPAAGFASRPGGRPYRDYENYNRRGFGLNR